MDKRVKTVAWITAGFGIVLIFLVVICLNMSKTMPAGSVVSQIESQSQIQEIHTKDFLSDPDFLDEEQPNMKPEEWEQAFDKSIFLSASSVQRDLRIMILNSAGQPVAGETFYVKIKGVGEYKDLDADGMIYIDGLRAGTYSVSVKEHDDYIMPPEIKVSVKDKIEYARIDDVRYLIKTEADINVAEEDTRKRQVEADETENKAAWTDVKNATLGIDVSKWNKEIDWNAVKEDGVKFAIIRCGYRGSKTGALVEDPYFKKNLEGAKAAGIKVGVYFFTQAVTEIEAVEEASMVLSLTEGYSLELPIFIDTEGAGGRADSLNVEDRTAVCRAFCDTIESGGCRAGIYASRNWYNTKIKGAEFDKYVKWLAEYRKEPLYAGKYDIWQYTSSGNINGIEGRVDMNLSYLE